MRCFLYNLCIYSSGLEMQKGNNSVNFTFTIIIRFENWTFQDDTNNLRSKIVWHLFKTLICSLVAGGEKTHHHALPPVVNVINK